MTNKVYEKANPRDSTKQPQGEGVRLKPSSAPRPR